MNNKFYTYIYLDPRKSENFIYGDYSFDYEPFYIGKGKNNQYLMHLIQSKNNNDIPLRENRHKFYKIKNILKEGLEPIILKVEENLTEQEAFDLEIWLIWAIGRSDLKLGSLTNMTDGGIGIIQPSEETKVKCLSRRIGHKHSEETRLKISEALKGKIKTKEHRDNLGKAGKGRIPWNKDKTHFVENNADKYNGWTKPSRLQLKQYVRTEETRQKMSKAQIGSKNPNYGRIPWNKGVQQTEEQRRKNSESQKGRKAWNKGLKNIYSDETLQKMSDASKGEKNSNFGKHLSEETKRKIRESLKKINRQGSLSILEQI